MNDAGSALVRETRSTVMRHIWIALPVFLLCGAAVTFAALKMRPVYTADSTVFVMFGRECVYRPEVGSAERAEGLDLVEIVNTEVQILESRDIAEHVVDTITAERLYPEIFLGELDPEKARQKSILEFRDSLTVLPVLESSVITVSLAHFDPKVASEALNLLIEAFLEKHLELFRRTQPGFIDEKLAIWQDRLKATEAQLLALKEEHGFVDLVQQTAHLLGQEAELNSNWIAHEAALAEIRSKRELLEGIYDGDSNGSSATGIDTVEVLQARREAFSTEWSQSQLRIVELAHEIASLRGRDLAGVSLEGPEFRSLDSAQTRLLELHIEKQGLIHSYRADSRKVRAVEKEILAVETFIAARTSQVRESLISTTEQTLSAERSGRVALRDELATKIEEIDRAIGRRQLLDLGDLQASIDAQKAITESLRESVRGEIRRLDRVSQEVVRLQRELATSERNVDTYLQRQEEAFISEDLDRQKRTSVRVLERAATPMQPSGLSPKLKIALGLVAGVFAGIAAAVGVEMMRGSNSKS